jgi:hypothetical protein
MKSDIRLATVDDLAFIKDSWLKAEKHTFPNSYALDFSEHFHSHMASIIDQSVILVAHLWDDANEILSYLIYSSFRNSQVIHFAYTKSDARRQGILNKLIKFSNVTNAPIVFTHAAKNENIMKALCKHYIYDPNILKLMGLA